MNALLMKIMAVGLTVSQVFTKAPDQVKLNFNPQTEQEIVAQSLKEGCTFMIKHFKAEDLDAEELLEMMVPKAKPKQEGQETDAARTTPATPGTVTDRLTKDIDFVGLLAAYKMFCKGEKVEGSSVKLDEVIKFYNDAMKDLPDVAKLKSFKLPETAVVLDNKGQRFSEIYSQNNRRLVVPLSQIPQHVQKAVVAAEDKNFYKHNGVDIFGLIRAFGTNMTSSGRPQGGSTITQQVIKNLLLNDDVTFERKMREMVLAVKLEQVLKKEEILELYLNFVFLGRTSWGVEMASKSYFGKTVKDVTLAEAALLAGLIKGPNYYNPDTQKERVTERRQYVLARMKQDGYIPEPAFNEAVNQPIRLNPFEAPHLRGGYYFLDAIQREARSKGLLGRPYIVRSTIHPEMQKIVETSLRDGLVEYEDNAKRVRWSGTQGSIAADIEKYKSTWQEILPKVQAKMFDVPWTLAVVLDTQRPRIGLRDGRTLPLRVNSSIQRDLKVYDLVFVWTSESSNSSYATLRNPPQVQGSAIVMEAKTGAVLAMAGGFSYGASQLNRALNSLRQPGSTLKPFIYLAALNLKYQPNTLIPDMPVRLPPMQRGEREWTPKNYDGGSRGLVTIRTAIEQSLNLPTVRIMSQLGRTPMEGLDYIRGITQELGIYAQPERNYPFVLGAQGTRLIDMAAAYATVANDGLKPTAHFIDSIDDGGRTTKMFSDADRLKRVQSVDRVAFYQLRRILTGTVVRGTAAKLKDLTGFMGAKTGTSNDERDAWFVGFTNDLVVAVWVGYDDNHVRRNLGDRFTGGRVALPIAEKILRASFDAYKQKEEMAPPPEEIRNQLTEQVISLQSGEFTQGGDFREIFRRDNSGQRPLDTVRLLLRDNEQYLGYNRPMGEEDNPYNVPQLNPGDWRQQPYYQQPPPGYYQPGYQDPYEQYRRNQRIDPYLMRPPYYQPPYGGR